MSSRLIVPIVEGHGEVEALPVLIRRIFGAFREGVIPAIKRAMQVDDRPCIIDFQVCREENVMPMVPAGGSVDQMLLS